MSCLESTGSKPGTRQPPRGQLGVTTRGEVTVFPASSAYRPRIWFNVQWRRGEPAGHRIIAQKMSLVPEVREPAEGGTGDIPWPPSYTLRRQSSPVSSFSLACALSHFSLTWAWTQANLFTSDLQQAASCWTTQTQLHGSAFLFTGKPKTPRCILDLNKRVLHE